MNATTEKLRPRFNPQSSDPCFCKSGRTFGACCGSTASARKPPHGVQILENYISSEICNNWVDQAKKKQRNRLMVVDLENSTREKIAEKYDSRRVTEKVVLGNLQAEIDHRIKCCIRREVVPYYKRKIAWFESATLLRYTTGGTYKGHADADYFNTEKQRWYQCMDRNISILLYLNDTFTGGALNFKYFNYRYQPKKGDLLFFPSDYRYLHEAEPVTSGVRYAAVSWAAISNSPRIKVGPPLNRIILDRTGLGF